MTICREIDWREPYAAYAPLAQTAHAHLFHAGDRAAGEWSVLVAHPAKVFELREGDAASWLREIDREIAARKIEDASPMPAPFHSGLLGFVGYEALKSFEGTLALPSSPYALPDAWFGAYDAAAVFNRDEKRAFIVGREEEACARLRETIGEKETTAPQLPVFSKPQSTFTREEYERSISHIIERIADGDFYQANIAQTLKADTRETFSPFDLFRTLAEKSDARFAALLNFEAGAIVSNSPERFFRIEENRITVEPIKGTRPRGSAPNEDLALAEALLHDPKDRAENIMIADLMRNDLSRICEDGSIAEEAICELLSLSKVHHLVSRISGVLKNGTTYGDIFEALFPSGSVTGAPKIEAMNAIAAVEKQGRGPYCGAIGYIDDRGGADFSVAIRTMMTDAARTSVAIPVGGGITLRSKPDLEFEETLVKARSAMDALFPEGAAS